jgi:3-mercaptopyruvate sulfurtransferase SseA
MRKSAVVLALAIAGAAFGQMKVGSESPVKISGTNVVTQTAEPPLESAKRIERDQAIKLVKEGKAVWVDVRGKDQYDLGHIKGAINLPLSEVIARVRELPPKKEIITYCA